VKVAPRVFWYILFELNFHDTFSVGDLPFERQVKRHLLVDAEIIHNICTEDQTEIEEYFGHLRYHVVA
jgi:hypothetical protein